MDETEDERALMATVAGEAATESSGWTEAAGDATLYAGSKGAWAVGRRLRKRWLLAMVLEFKMTGLRAIVSMREVCPVVFISDGWCDCVEGSMT